MVHLTTNRIPGFFGEFSAVVPKADHSRFIAVGITPDQDAGSLGRPYDALPQRSGMFRRKPIDAA
jgi:hypothetical protein